MHRALWMLIGLQMRGWFRALGRHLQTAKGLLFALVALGVFVPWLLMIVMQRRNALPAEQILTHGPAYLLVYCLMNVLLSGGERAVYYSPAEVTFLFTGPFSRRQLLGYKVVLSLFYTLPTTLFLTAVFRVHASWLLAAFLGTLLTTTFMQMFGMALNLTAEAVGAGIYSRARKVVLVAVLVAAVLVFRSAQQEGLEEILQSSTWHVLTTPLRWFFEAFLADSWFDLVRFGSLGLLVNLMLLGVVFGLDADYLESAAAYSSRVYAQIQRLRGGPSIAGGDDRPSAPSKTRRGMPMPPNFGGIGPLAWRQLTTAVRSPSRFIGLLIVQAIMIGSLRGGVREASGMAAALDVDVALMTLFVMGIFVAMLSLFMTRLLPFDFRGDLDRLETLKTLPLAPWRIALGQILVPTIALSVMQWLTLAGLAAIEVSQASSNDSTLGTELLLLLAGAFLAVPFNFMLFGLENVLFLLAPARLMGTTPLDLQAMGRNVVAWVAKLLMLGAVIVGAFLVGSVVYVVSGQYLLPAIAGAWIVLAVSGAIVIPMAGLAFTWIDVSRDKPA